MQLKTGLAVRNLILRGKDFMMSGSNFLGVNCDSTEVRISSNFLSRKQLQSRLSLILSNS